MALDIFSAFDDHNKTFSMYWMMWLMPLTIISLTMKKSPLYMKNEFMNLTFMKISAELVSRTKTINMGGSLSAFSTIILSLIFMNFLGLTPYVFSSTSHLAINLSMALPLWMSIIFMSSMFNLKLFLAHFQPSGSPAALNPFLCLIELISTLIRPVTLAVRLTANLSTGHILMGLLGTAFSSSAVMTATMITMLGSLYFIFEMAVCFIQGYIFTLLPSLYADEHPS